MKAEELRNKLTEKGLKVTPQRMVILDAIYALNHPTAENISDVIRRNHPNISTATVYKVLDAFVSCGLIQRVQTERDHMRYDALMENHHHLYCPETDRIEDYNDEELNELLAGYFKKKNIPNFKIEDLKLQIIGKFDT
ncbi:Fur family transcriptional regulator [Saccharicrinis sp. FJH2]|uniref:Fur family transcriptional regulator n=1 Tax=Saccharicrinis sp. FJH65 TaxID=3344659 RepID=UPI0035F45B78